MTFIISKLLCIIVNYVIKNDKIIKVHYERLNKVGISRRKNLTTVEKKIIEIISKYCRGNVKFLIVKNIYYVKMSKNQIQI